MTSETPPPPKSQAQQARDKRLADALRANLRRRKTADSTGLAARDGKPAVSAPPREGDETEG